MSRRLKVTGGGRGAPSGRGGDPIGATCPVCAGSGIARLASGDIDACPACARAAEAEYRAMRADARAAEVECQARRGGGYGRTAA